ncbi:type IX secretion system membrane protein PorP/SprF [Pontibacter diazotrophicus]|uniref:Type IX secretion system membrane protein PorP/SprF n=1 Tax=Pontibacter diazotrophicus TaxID=1400979 RepID=A0A3D8L8N5_9BACT|nr:type IX secretion system membrane protein PorP/SprF [Pontibacter diazotrophicus]RDV13693.1 type IX secretion system membrane protein PorP/SprF [Pontibacter diazotrophicus]
MKKLLLLTCLVSLVWDLQAQSGKQFANFSQYKHYFNPSLTGSDGSVIKSIYRNQWTGFEGAPNTGLVSAEIGTSMFGRDNRRNHFRREDRGGSLESISAKHALGLTVLSDQFGPLKETQFALSYGSGVRLSEALSLRWGVALTYAAQRLDGNSLTVDQKDDPRYNNVLGRQNRSSKGDINLGLSLVSPNYYLGYALQDITQGRMLASGDNFMEDAYTLRHIVQAGYRRNISNHLGFTVNSIYSLDNTRGSVVEGQVKAVYQNMFWVGGGYRNDLAYNLTAGVRFNQFHVGYAYESPVQSARGIDKGTNEITLSYSLMPQKGRRNNQLSVW